MNKSALNNNAQQEPIWWKIILKKKIIGKLLWIITIVDLQWFKYKKTSFIYFSICYIIQLAK